MLNRDTLIHDGILFKLVIGMAHDSYMQKIVVRRLLDGKFVQPVH